MRFIKKVPSEKWLSWFNYNQKKLTEWSSYPRKGKGFLRSSLKKEQYGLCAFCGSRLLKNHSSSGRQDITFSHIEHLKNRSTHPELTFDYNNVFLSCGHYHKNLEGEIIEHNKHCGGYKDVYQREHFKNDFSGFRHFLDNSLLSPADSETKTAFAYGVKKGVRGEIVPLSLKAYKTILIYNLNTQRLIHFRKEIINEIDSLLQKGWHYSRIRRFLLSKESKTTAIFKIPFNHVGLWYLKFISKKKT